MRQVFWRKPLEDCTRADSEGPMAVGSLIENRESSFSREHKSLAGKARPHGGMTEALPPAALGGQGPAIVGVMRGSVAGEGR